MDEARMEKTEHGLMPASDGWFVANLGEVAWFTVAGGGTWSDLEGKGSGWETMGAGIHVLPPGETPGFYHLENQQEGFLVLSGECVAVVEGSERRMGPWDYFHCPAGTAHITIGAEGDEPCALFMLGARRPDRKIHYPVEPAAARYGASVEVATDNPREAYAERPPIVPAAAPPGPWSRSR
jgi:uncharacterized cupin superfamily protein